MMASRWSHSVSERRGEGRQLAAKEEERRLLARALVHLARAEGDAVPLPPETLRRAC